MTAFQGNIDQRLWQRLRRDFGRATGDFRLIEEGDRIAVGVSGGKDSFTLLLLLKELQKRAPVSFQICAINIDSGYPGYRKDLVEDFLKEQQIQYTMVPTEHYNIISEKRRPGSSYCSICARLKRGALYGAVTKLGCNKLALGHHRDDFIETLLLNQFFVGSLKAMAAKMLADNGQVTVIRPLVYLSESDIISFAKQAKLPVTSCQCPVADSADLRRQQMKNLLTRLEQEIPHIKNSLLAALGNVQPRHLLIRE